MDSSVKGRGVVAVNLGDEEATITVPTTLPSGAYCDVVTHGPFAASWPGDATIEVADGAVTIALALQSATAIHLGSRAG